ncbi:hypothetical protein GGQ74_001731 [Desulfobaculum xiamenense]|uniref:Uncharacterized protein n=1 Tax=Desulfobaculum xiamenense TaxID=995050 RepID=A0A846QIJ9_9BACT|nr:hypothetical protein [Desulfobaculum xiamenense]NJB68058.1 hypothetical protein [Desulfobaculum xiamenense]
MKRIITILASALILSCLTIGSAFAAEVVQGKCLGYDTAAATIEVEEYDINFSKDHPYGHSTGIRSLFNVKEAKIGITPETGDVLRIAYDVKGSQKMALKVMNVSKQDLSKK